MHFAYFISDKSLLYGKHSKCDGQVYREKTTTSHTTLQKISKIKCVERFNKERESGRSTLAGYNKATKTCYLSNEDPLDVLDTNDEMTGVFFYEPEPTGITIQHSYDKCMFH